jgi:ribosomal protein S18 acetylase RimI-like enzyme
MEIREALQSDANSIAEIHTASWRNSYQDVLSKDYLNNVVLKERLTLWSGRLCKTKSKQYVIVAESEGEILGFACFYVGENPQWGSYLDNLHIRKAHQSKGIGKLLIQKGARWCYQLEPSKGMCLLVNQDNLKAQVFYKWLGARNAKEGVWKAPDGSVVATYWFVWEQLDRLL